MRITSKGQVTIPASLRLRLGLLPNTEVVFEEVDGGAVIRPALSLGELMDQRLRTVRGMAKGGLTADEIMQLTRGEED